MNVGIGNLWRLSLLLLIIAIALTQSLASANSDDTVVSVIVTADSMQHAREAVEGIGAEVTHELSVIDAVGANILVSQITTLAENPHVLNIHTNAPVHTASHTQTVQDSFGKSAYNNNNGTAAWLTDWEESGDDGNPWSGRVLIFWDALVMKDDDRRIQRSVDLTGASEATLSFEYGLWSFENYNDFVTLQIKAGDDWVTLDSYHGPGHDYTRHAVSYDISDFISDNTTIRFVTSDDLSKYDSFSIDNIEIRYTVGDASLSGSQTYIDEFSSKTYSANNGTIPWNSPWVEENDYSDASGGDVYISSGSLIIKDNNKLVRRIADLSDATNAILSIETQLDSLEHEHEYVTLDVSADYGQTWHELNRFAGPADEDDYTVSSYDLADYLGQEVIIRLTSSNTFGDAGDDDDDDRCTYCWFGGGEYDKFRIDSIQIDFVIDQAASISEEIIPASTMVNANELHDAGITGDGITVAIIDSGFVSNAALDFTASGFGRILTQFDAIQNTEINPELDGIVQSDDTNGHGTHIASIIANSNMDESARSFGIAPDVNLAIYKAFSSDGIGNYADVIRALDKIVAQKDELNIRVINMSFYSTPQSHYWEDPLNQAVMRAWEAGIVVVTGAGNTGPDAMSIGVPGNIPYVITVGAYTDNFTPFNTADDYIPPFSSAGPTYEGFVKPEIIAPGAHILGLLSADSSIVLNNPTLQSFGDLFPLSGTSMSSAVTSGVVALMLQSDPHLTPDDVKCRLIDSATAAVDDEGNLQFSIFQQGAGVINAFAAVNSTASGCANGGLDISADLDGTEHYVGNVTRNVDGHFVILDENGVENLSWDGSYAQTDGNYLWTGGNYLWTGGSYLWTGGNYLWTGGNYLWTGGNYLWAGGSYLWTGGNYLWAGTSIDATSATSNISFIINSP